MSIAIFGLRRFYHPATDACGQAKISAIRDVLAAQKIATGTSRHRKFRQNLAGMSGVSVTAALEQLRLLAQERQQPDLNVVINAQVRLTKEQ